MTKKDSTYQADRPNESSETRIGYRNPPREHQFRKGQSGNPTGRPRRSKTFSSLVMRELGRRMTITEGGKRRRVTKKGAAAKQLVNKLVLGDPAALKLMLSSFFSQEATHDSQAEAYGRDTFQTIAEVFKNLAAYKAKYGPLNPESAENPDSAEPPKNEENK